LPVATFIMPAIAQSRTEPELQRAPASMTSGPDTAVSVPPNRTFNAPEVG
jgi:hypothetical protein